MWVNNNALPSQAGPSVKRGLKGPATISNSHPIVPSSRSRAVVSLRRSRRLTLVGGRTSLAQTLPALAHRLYRALDPHLHRDIVLSSDITAQTTVLERDAIGIGKVDGFGPLVVHDICDCDSFGQQLLTFGFQRYLRAGLKGKMIKRA